MIEPGIYYDISHDDYHALEGYVSNSYLSRLDKCPAAAKVPQEQTEAMTFGIAFHAFILDGPEIFEKTVAVLPEINRRTNAGKAEYEAFIESHKGCAVISSDDLIAIKAMDTSVKAHPMASRLIGVGKNEVSIFWNDPFSGLPCKARTDKAAGNGALIDLKKTKDASPYGFRSSVLKYGYHRQAAFYLDGITKASGEPHDLFAFIVVEDTEPYRCEVYTLSEDFVTYGRHDYQRLITLENRCRQNNYWPNFTNADATELQLPKYLNFVE